MSKGPLDFLILNWRSPGDPKSGGAELVTHEISKRVVRRGHSVTLFAAEYDGCSRFEDVDGVRVIRAGNELTVRWHAYRQLRKRVSQYSLVVDQINTIPFWTPLWLRDSPRAALVHQLTREIWWSHMKWPIAAIGSLVERTWLRLYRSTPVLSGSPSVLEELANLGFSGPFFHVPYATNAEPLAELPKLEEKESGPVICYVGRLVASKMVDDAIRGLAHLRGMGYPQSQLYVVGQGDTEYTAKLKSLARDLGLGSSVHFKGRVSEREKLDLMRRASAIVMCSIREGWGLVVTEANSQGTVAVVYDAPGLRDSTRHNETGLVCRDRTPRDLAVAVASLWDNPKQHESMRATALEWSRAFTWERSVDAFLDAAHELIRDRPGH